MTYEELISASNLAFAGGHYYEAKKNSSPSCKIECK